MITLSYFKLVKYERSQYRALELQSRVVERELTALGRDYPASIAAKCPYLYPLQVYEIEHRESVGKLHAYVRAIKTMLMRFKWSVDDIATLPSIRAIKNQDDINPPLTAIQMANLLEKDREHLERLASKGPFRHLERRLKMVDEWHNSFAPFTLS